MRVFVTSQQVRFIHGSTSPFAYLSFCLSLHLSIYLSIHPSSRAPVAPASPSAVAETARARVGGPATGRKGRRAAGRGGARQSPRRGARLPGAMPYASAMALYVAPAWARAVPALAARAPAHRLPFLGVRRRQRSRCNVICHANGAGSYSRVYHFVRSGSRRGEME